MRDEYTKMLEVENERLRDQVAGLREALEGFAQFPKEWCLTAGEERLLKHLVQRGTATKDQLMHSYCLDPFSDEAPEIKIIDVLICKIRKKLMPFEINISTNWGRGYSLDDTTRARLKNSLIGRDVA